MVFYNGGHLIQIGDGTNKWSVVGGYHCHIGDKLRTVKLLESVHGSENERMSENEAGSNLE